MNIYESITKIMEEVPAINKDKVNKQQGFKFRGIDDVMNALQPLLAKYKVFIVPEMLEQTREERQTKTGGNLIYSICRIKFRFYAEDGTNIEAITIGEGMDSGDKATNKAMAIAMKYVMFQVFCIPTEEMKDPDNEVAPENTKLKKQVNNGQAISETLDKDTSLEKIAKTQENALRLVIKKYNIATDFVINTLDDMGYEKLADLKQKDYMSFYNILEKVTKS